MTSASGQIISSPSTTLTSIAVEGPYMCQSLVRKFALTRYLAVPIRSADGKAIGVLGLHPSAAYLHTDDSAVVLEAVANLIGADLSHAHDRHVIEGLLDLTLVADLLSEKQSDDRVLQSALERMRAALGAAEVIYVPPKGPQLRAATSDTPLLDSEELLRTAEGGYTLTVLPPTLPLRDTHVVVATASLDSGQRRRGTVIVADRLMPRASSVHGLVTDPTALHLASRFLSVFLDCVGFMRSVTTEAENNTAMTLAIAHEFVTPLTGLQGRVAILREETAQTFKDHRTPPFVFFDDILQILDDLDTFSKGLLSLTESGLTLTNTPYYSGVFLRVYDVLKRQAQERKCRIDFKADDFYRSLPKLSIDAKLSRHVLYNVLKNAIKYSPTGGVVTVRPETTATNWRIVVGNHGAGVPADEVEKIFEPFQRGSNVTDTSVRGAGLGLWIAQRIMLMHGGKVQLLRLSDPVLFAIEYPR